MKKGELRELYQMMFEQAKEVKTYEERRAQRALSDDV